VTAARTPDADSGNAVELIDLRRSFGSAVALDGLTMDIARGELVALLGPSGCGKTTALRALAGLEDLDGGRVVVHGRDVTHLPANKRDTRMVFQAYSLFPHLSALENVGYGLRLATRRVPARRSAPSSGTRSAGSRPRSGPRPCSSPTTRRRRSASPTGSASCGRAGWNSSPRRFCCTTARPPPSSPSSSARRTRCPERSRTATSRCWAVACRWCPARSPPVPRWP